MKRYQVKGYLFEVIIGKLLESVGYRWEVSTGNQKIRGRGAFHEIDAIGIGSNITPFVNNIRLLAEAKYYDKGDVGLPVVRNMFGALTDINESYTPDDKPIAEKLLGRRDTNCAVIFSNRDFSKDAIDYGYAHNIYLVSYNGNPVMTNIIQDFEVIFSKLDFRKVSKNKLRLKQQFNDLLRGQDIRLFKERHIDGELSRSLTSIRDRLSSTGSVLGFIQGSYPIHITSLSSELPGLILTHPVQERGQIRVFYHFEMVGNNLLFNFNLGEVRAEFTLPVFLFERNIREGSMISAKEVYLGNIYVPIVTSPGHISIIDLVFDANLRR